jgi:hypothetical protein
MENVVWVCPMCEIEIPFGNLVTYRPWYLFKLKTKLIFDGHDIAAHIWWHEA